MRTKFCPHCGSEKIHRVSELKSYPSAYYTKTQLKEMLNGECEHYHECEDCNETWEHHKENK